MRGTVIAVNVINSPKFAHSPVFNHSILHEKKKIKREVEEFYRKVVLFIGIL